MNPDIDSYIREHSEQYTRAAMREQLITAGHDPAAIDEALDRAEVERQAPAARSWRLGQLGFLLLVGLGTVGAGVVWAGQPYGAGGIAAVIYAVVAAIALGVGWLVSWLVDRGHVSVVAGLFALAGGVALYSLAIGGGGTIGMLALLGCVTMAAALLILRRYRPGWAGALAAAVPILLWLIVTGTCYSPVFTTTGG